MSFAIVLRGEDRIACALTSFLPGVGRSHARASENGVVICLGVADACLLDRALALLNTGYPADEILASVCEGDPGIANRQWAIVSFVDGSIATRDADELSGAYGLYTYGDCIVFGNSLNADADVFHAAAMSFRSLVHGMSFREAAVAGGQVGAYAQRGVVIGGGYIEVNRNGCTHLSIDAAPTERMLQLLASGSVQEIEAAHHERYARFVDKGAQHLHRGYELAFTKQQGEKSSLLSSADEELSAANACFSEVGHLDVQTHIWLAAVQQARGETHAAQRTLKQLMQKESSLARSFLEVARTGSEGPAGEAQLRLAELVHHARVRTGRSRRWRTSSRIGSWSIARTRIPRGRFN